MTTTPSPIDGGPDTILGESPYWSERDGRLYWIDIQTPTLHSFDSITKTCETVSLPEPATTVAEHAAGGLVCTTSSSFNKLQSSTGTLNPITAPEEHFIENRFNDGACDRKGRMWAGTVSRHRKPNTGHLYSVGKDNVLKLQDRGLNGTNGIAWSPDDKQMFVAESWNNRILVYDFDLEQGAITNRRQFTRIATESGKPDGLTVDAEGFVWCALWDGWSVMRFDPNGRLERSVRLPVPRPSSCTFGGATLDTLYITSARYRLSDEQIANAPLSGKTFVLQPDIQGMPEVPFNGCNQGSVS